jgi:hypothetical protein
VDSRQRQVIGVAVLGLLVVLGIAALSSADADGERIGTDAGIFARAGLTTVAEAAPAVADPTTTTTAAATVPAPTTTLRRPLTTKAPATTTTALRPAASASTTAPAPLVAAAVTSTSTTVPATTTTTLDPCRNSVDPKCGPFRFDPQPGTDNPMTVEVTAEPASPVAGQPLVFHITLRDPDGVSYDGTNFNFGNSGIGGSTPEPCAKFGPWDPPARDPASATKIMDVGHTYFEAGTYTATFFFDAGPFDCVDSVTGRGDRPYASSATGTVSVQVTAPA